MNPELKLRFLKALMNIPLRVADRVLPEPPKANFPQTQILLRVYSRLSRAYRLECVQGTFGAEPDGNFERLLRVSLKLLARMSEEDRYYRAWLGLTLLLTRSELAGLDPRPRFLKRMIKEQWLMDIDFLPDAYVSGFRDEFEEMAMCDYLCNLARLEN